MRILVATNDLAWRRNIHMEFTAVGYACDFVSDGLKAFEVAKTGQIDLLLLDNDLKECSGETVARAFRNHNEELPIIIVLATLDSETRVRLLSSGVDACFRKFEDDKLVLAQVEPAKNNKYKSYICVGDFELERIDRDLLRFGSTVELNKREFQIFKTLLQYSGTVVTYEKLQNCGRFYNAEKMSYNSIDRLIERINIIISVGREVLYIHKVEEVGYYLDDELIMEWENPNEQILR
ncbi:MAG: response regulator transcription factor [Patescibacteria group bacterium]|nr:response regulator transcription factor [Patescibacteria group bacterium]